LQEWSRQHFSRWLENQDLLGSGYDGCLERRGIPDRTMFHNSRWDEDCMYEFFQFKDNNGGSQGSHCLEINFGI
jgi:hypothetical protein